MMQTKSSLNAKGNKVVYPGIEMVKTGKWLRCVTRYKGIPVRRLCTLIGLSSTQSVYAWFCGHCLPSLDNLYALGYVFQMPMDDLIIERTRQLPGRFCEMGNDLGVRMLRYHMELWRC